MNKNERFKGFNSLPLKRRKAIIAMIETDKILEEIRRDVHIGRTMFYNWRNKDEAFQTGLQEYSKRYMNQATAKALRKMWGLWMPRTSTLLCKRRCRSSILVALVAQTVTITSPPRSTSA
ncbi:hypothetical protein [Lacticaseibacillus rhamnosus]|uniref:hypothetical protein n=1 Tax=Lacticaseibacillus rhamnosus TaxID=47715 RepID=UPI000AECD2A1|nr:hypothetical protein [Lacticaseibacillus rhamnosus]